MLQQASRSKLQAGGVFVDNCGFVFQGHDSPLSARVRCQHNGTTASNALCSINCQAIIVERFPMTEFRLVDVRSEVVPRPSALRLQKPSWP